MATTVGQAISRVRNIIKAVKTDAFVTDRFLYSLILKYSDMYIKQELDKGRTQMLNPLYKTLPCVELIEVNKVEACCDIQGCTIYRTKDKLPKIMTNVTGLLVRAVTSIDGTTRVNRTEPATYQSITKTSGFKYNKDKYYWFINDYMYFPNLGWPQVKIDALFTGDISKFLCDSPCTTIQSTPSPIPEHLYALIEQGVLKDLGMSVQVPTDQAGSDKQSVQKP